MSQRKLVIETLNDQTLTLVTDGETLTVRIAKDGHNRGIVKLSPKHESAIAAFLAEVTK